METEVNNSSSDERKKCADLEGGGEDDDDILKRRIAAHPLYGLLVEAHLDCLKVGIGSTGDVDGFPKFDEKTVDKQPNMLRNPDLDHFMKAYCMALRKLKEAMEEPQHATMAFINTIHCQLKELEEVPSLPSTSQKTSPSGNEEQKDA